MSGLNEIFKIFLAVAGATASKRCEIRSRQNWAAPQHCSIYLVTLSFLNVSYLLLLFFSGDWHSGDFGGGDQGIGTKHSVNFTVSLEGVVPVPIPIQQ